MGSCYSRCDKHMGWEGGCYLVALRRTGEHGNVEDGRSN